MTIQRDQIIGKKYKLSKKLGKGAFGEIWEATNFADKQRVAIKFEEVDDRNQQLYLECKIYLWFHSEASVIAQAIPQVKFYGTQAGKNIMIMDLLGPSLESLFQMCKSKFSLKTTLMCALQMLKRVEYIHSRRIIHRDIKPDNFAIGHKKQQHRIFILDFGLAKKYMNSNKEHIPYKDGKGLTGTARYASINTHLGIEQSRRDDLETLAYVFIYFLKGVLPWQGLKVTQLREKYNKIKEKKIKTTIEELCRDLPIQFLDFLKMTRELQFSEEPNYNLYKQMFQDLMDQRGYKNDSVFDWVEKDLVKWD